MSVLTKERVFATTVTMVTHAINLTVRKDALGEARALDQKFALAFSAGPDWTARNLLA